MSSQITLTNHNIWMLYKMVPISSTEINVSQAHLMKYWHIKSELAPISSLKTDWALI